MVKHIVDVEDISYDATNNKLELSDKYMNEIYLEGIRIYVDINDDQDDFLTDAIASDNEEEREKAMKEIKQKIDAAIKFVMFPIKEKGNDFNKLARKISKLPSDKSREKILELIKGSEYCSDEEKQNLTNYVSSINPYHGVLVACGNNSDGPALFIAVIYSFN